MDDERAPLPASQTTFIRSQEAVARRSAAENCARQPKCTPNCGESSIAKRDGLSKRQGEGCGAGRSGANQRRVASQALCKLSFSIQAEFVTHANLVSLAVAWLRRYRCGVVLSEQACASGEMPDAIGKMKQFASLFTHGIRNGSELRYQVHHSDTAEEILTRVDAFFAKPATSSAD